MAIYKNITSDDTHTLIVKKTGISGSIRKMSICNHHDSSKNIINLFLYDGTNTYVIAETIIPARSTLVLTDNLSYDNRVYDLKITTDDDGGATSMTIILK